VGPKWETGQTPHQAFNAQGLLESLVAATTDTIPLLDQVAKTRAELAVKGINYGVVAYEGGPSGYYVPGQGSPEQVAISQLYGKSQALALASLDTWLYSSQQGYSYQQFFSLASGTNWTSHTLPLMGGFRRHIAWLALTLRNRYVPGRQMVTVESKNVPEYRREGKAIPQLTAYAFRGDNSLAVFVLSRAQAGRHNGTDFGNGIIPLTLKIGSDNWKKLTRYALTSPSGQFLPGDTSNAESEKVVITSVELGAEQFNTGQVIVDKLSGAVAGGVPPGAILLYVFTR
jgi:hypothetical protein